MFISLDSVVEAARQRLAALTPEVAGYVVLMAARRLEARPSRVSPSNILLTDAGDVQCRPDSAASELDAEAALRGVLGTLLELSPSPVPAITDVAEGSGSGSLSALAEELSAALIPINHAAARRALARLYRETFRARGSALDAVAWADSAAELAPEPSPPELTAKPPPVAPVIAGDRSNELDIDVDVEPEPMAAVSELDAPLVPPASVPPVEPIRRESSVASLPPVVSVPATAAAAPALASVIEPPSKSPAASLESVAAARSNGAPHGPREQRSDLRELLLRYLAEARSDELKMRQLRAMIGIDDDSALKDDDGASAR
jgi:hypothetical protein